MKKTWFGTAKKAMIVFLIVIGAAVVLAALAIFSLRLANANKAAIDTGTGVQESAYVEIGGVEQYVQIRGQNARNPVILWLHGGPGFPLTYLTPYYQTGLEEDYTVACWEQRGCGRTYYRNQSAGAGGDAPDVERLLADADEVVDYLRERFGQEKIVIIGQSWGTVLGTRYASLHPEKVAAYIGVGQVTDFSQGKMLAAQRAMEKAAASGNGDDVEALKQGIERLADTHDVEYLDLPSLEKMIVASLTYLKPDGEMSGAEQLLAAVTSPEMSWDDARWFLFASDTRNVVDSQSALVDYMYFRFDFADFGDKLAVPLCFIQGEGDWITPTSLVEERYATVAAPLKRIAVIDGAGHTPFLDDPERFCAEVKTFLGECGIGR